jgi:GT2 family glycosyltransferase
VQGLAIVTVTHNSARELPRLLESVERHLPGARIVVVDSGSGDGSMAIARAHKGATVIDLGINAGFARGCNAGLKAVVEPVTVLLNPDVELIDDSLAALAAHALEPQAPERLLAPLVLDGNGRRQDSVHPLPTSPADLLRAFVPPGAVPRLAAQQLDPWRACAPRRVGWAVGCALVARTDALRALGPFDPRYFLYGEDLDLALRAARRGIETWFWPQSRVIHHRAHATQLAFGGEPLHRLAQARHTAVREGLGPRRARLDDAAQALTFVSRGALKRVAGRSALRERRQLEALASLRRDEHGWAGA